MHGQQNIKICYAKQAKQVLSTVTCFSILSEVFLSLIKCSTKICIS